MKFDQADPEQEVFMIDSEGGETRMEYYELQSRNTAMFQVPW